MEDPDAPQDTVWWRLINLQPAAWRGIVMAVFVFLAAVGIKVAPQIPDAAFLVILALLPVIQAVWTKTAVTPNAKVLVRVPDPVNQPLEIEAGQAVVPITDMEKSADILQAAETRGA